MNAWAKFVTKYYKDKRRTNKDYKFKDAMKDAKVVYAAQKGQTMKNTTKKGGKTQKRR